LQHAQNYAYAQLVDMSCTPRLTCIPGCMQNHHAHESGAAALEAGDLAEFNGCQAMLKELYASQARTFNAISPMADARAAGTLQGEHSCVTAEGICASFLCWRMSGSTE